MLQLVVPSGLPLFRRPVAAESTILLMPGVVGVVVVDEEPRVVGAVVVDEEPGVAGAVVVDEVT